ncbi:MAG TPA: S41 family peptidase [Saprospiraceae bacterium]|nr:S41 family peptidase [Saprospiraceae bacterium]
MTKFLILFFSLIFVSFSQGQECTCLQNFEWVTQTFEANDAGFQYVIDNKGKQAYLSHNAEFAEKAKSIHSNSSCTQMLFEWSKFFRSGHFGIRLLKNTEERAVEKTVQSSQPNENWESLDVDVKKFEAYLAKKKDVDFEGIWETKPYKIGIKKEGEAYLGFIISSEAENWKAGHVKLKITKVGETLHSTFYLRDKSAENSNSVELLGSNYLQIGRFRLKRISPEFPLDKPIENYFASISSVKPFLEKLNETTLVLRIPSFDSDARRDIDSVILVNRDKILSTENLIVDLRNNGGGSDGSFRELIPFIYTNPIRIVNLAFYSTKLNNQRMLDFINDASYGFDDEDKKWAKESYEKLEKRIGEFVNLDSTLVSIKVLDTVYPYPKNVGIIINEGNGSTTEQFLLAAKQSKKVKLFGTTTFGVLDISNMYFVKSPCLDFELGYCLSRSLRIPDMTIDNKGIQPDYYIDKSIPKHEWVSFVDGILNAK